MHAFNNRMRDLDCSVSRLALFLDPRYKTLVPGSMFRTVAEEVC